MANDGFPYFVIFVDDFFMYTWFYPMKLKSNIYYIITEFRALVGRPFSSQIKEIHSDLGGEYKKLHTFFTSLGIYHR